MDKNNLSDIKNYLHNHTEDIVLKKLEKFIKEDDLIFCNCNQCLLDIISYSLNKLPAKYISSKKGNLHTRIAEFEQQYEVDLITHLTRAIQIITDNPSASCQKKKQGNPS